MQTLCSQSDLQLPRWGPPSHGCSGGRAAVKTIYCLSFNWCRAFEKQHNSFLTEQVLFFWHSLAEHVAQGQAATFHQRGCFDVLVFQQNGSYRNLQPAASRPHQVKKKKKSNLRSWLTLEQLDKTNVAAPCRRQHAVCVLTARAARHEQGCDNKRGSRNGRSSSPLFSLREADMRTISISSAIENARRFYWLPAETESGFNRI